MPTISRTRGAAPRDDAPGGSGGRTPFRGPLPIDAHVHLYDVFDPAAFLDGALANFRAGAGFLGLRPQPAGCLMFSETARDHAFRRLRAQAGTTGGAIGPWTFRPTAEADSLVAQRAGGETLLLIAGRQVATRERLEVLALGRDAEYSDGLEFGPTLEAVWRRDAIAVVPWGFGKWWFARGRTVARAMDRHDPSRPLYLGDNSGRPRALPTPPLFHKGRNQGMLVLPGTDPLPFKSEQTKAGRYGFLLDGAMDRDRPAAAIRDLLREQTAQPRAFGRLESLGRFLRNQVGMQIRKRGRPS